MGRQVGGVGGGRGRAGGNCSREPTSGEEGRKLWPAVSTGTAGREFGWDCDHGREEQAADQGEPEGECELAPLTRESSPRSGALGPARRCMQRGCGEACACALSVTSLLCAPPSAEWALSQHTGQLYETRWSVPELSPI